jgi:chromosome condensin MukBEF MukE localization factor
VPLSPNAHLFFYPNNRFPRQKLRQQLQRLRDLGMIEFLGEGRYRRTVKAQN